MAPKKVTPDTATLSDLNNQPLLVGQLTPSQAKALYEEAETTGFRPAGTVLRDLYYKSQENDTPATEEEQEAASAAAEGRALAQ